MSRNLCAKFLSLCFNQEENEVNKRLHVHKYLVSLLTKGIERKILSAMLFGMEVEV